MSAGEIKATKSLQLRMILFDALGELGSELWARSRQLEGLSNDPKMFSVALYRRLWSNFRGFRLLWPQDLWLETEILLRSAAETVICIAALRTLGPAFVDLIRSDAAFTLKGQIKLWRESGEDDLVHQAEAQLKMIFGHRRTDGGSHKPLDWKELADVASAPWLYGYHKLLSGTASHVTGLSVLSAFEPAEKEDSRSPGKPLKVSQERRLSIMLDTMSYGSCEHAAVIAERSIQDRIESVIRDLGALHKQASLEG